ncbi:MAG: roadblock/LC7 domain-containing protein [Carbonactinosporaceae bacterium]
MSPMSDEAQKFAWLVDNFVQEVPGATHVVVVSADGLLLCASKDIPLHSAEQLAAVASGMQGLAQGSSRLFDQGSCEQTIVRMQRGYLFIMAISDGSCLTVLASSDCDMKVVAYQMALLVESAGHVLTPQLRTELHGALKR